MQFIQSAILIFIGAIIGSILTIWGRFLFAKRTEYYRQRPLVKKALENTISRVNQHNHPWILVEDSTVDGLISDIIQVMPCCKRRRFKKHWNKYRYDKNYKTTVPDEYEQSTEIGRRLITERLHNLISKL